MITIFYRTLLKHLHSCSPNWHECVISTFGVLLSSNLLQSNLLCCVSDLRQELAVRQKERRPSSSLGIDADRGDAPSAGHPSIPATPSKPISSTFATPPASSIRRGWLMGRWNYLRTLTSCRSHLVVCVFATGDGLTGTPLTTSARISALNIVGELLRKVGVCLVY